ncbi:hypothetical protein PFICI_05822 [Pestalotiopsis fici W106-1]|uniref:Uncharacterized protein n=1 Tax=Pestalotiopsis fici (strain W106-1 / CGMCC3.15140) TaxID=1229662 RepID=W3XFF3_PESFW|nr:uncharacterized protein PFICI_05822 [Pestalotiopsis fici W106-1]ETS83946.1 hypothetical protein PFICI_05822 [Pestalotiopsis fici W106-1]
MHGDSGNTGDTDYAAPLGHNLRISSAAEQIAVIVWASDGSMIAGYGNASTNPITRAIGAVDPSTFEVLASWTAPVNQTLNLGYMEYILDTDEVLLSTTQGYIYAVHRENCDGVPSFTLRRTIDLTTTIKPWEWMLNSMIDAAGNIWFTTGGITGSGDPAQNSTTAGYVTPDGTVYAIHIENQMVENGIGVSGTSMYMATGLSGAANTSYNATGYMWAFAPEKGVGLKTVWKVPYNAGSGGKPGEITRGTGSTPVLMNDQFVVITDNEDPQINLLVYHQEEQESADAQLFCKVPLFQPGASSNENSVISHFDGDKYGLLVQNSYAAPPFELPGPGFILNGTWNDMSQMPGGFVRVDVNPKGGCEVRWTANLASKTVTLLSTKTGLLYSYIQDKAVTPTGQYDWYAVATDWATGEIAWKVRLGSGGIFNDNWLPASIGPDGQFYQAVFGGIVSVKDGL